MVYNHNFLINLEAAVINLTYTDTADEFVVINSRYKHLCVSIRVTFRCRNVINDTFK